MRLMSNTQPQPFKSGFAVMVGRSNVGKSTLLNALVGSKIAITTPKPQTTRLPIQGIVSSDQGQVVFVDTPGVFKKAKDALTKRLMDSVKDSLREIDVVLYVVDPTRAIGDEEKMALRLIEPLSNPKILVINKIDVERAPFLEFYRDLSDRFDDTIEISAKKGSNVHELSDKIMALLPEGEAYYPIGQISNMSHEMWLAELIREKLFLRLREELPSTLHVDVHEAVTRENGTLYVRASIVTGNERYKGMIIGKGGRGIKEIGQSTRKELSAVMNQPVFMDLEVTVDPYWINRLV